MEPAIQFPQVTLQGDPREVGRDHGQRCRQSIERLVELLGNARFPAEKRAFVDRMERYLHEHFPEIIEEWEGLALGAQLSFQQAFFLTAGVSAAELPGPHDCSAAAWTHPVYGSRLFKTDDGPGRRPEKKEADSLRDRLATKRVFSIQSGRGHRCLGIGSTGRLWLEAGVNDRGLVLGHTSGRPVLADQDGAGIPQHLFPALVLRYCGSVADAVAFSYAHPVAGKGVNIVVLDSTGAMAAIEKCGEYTGSRQSRAYAFTVNHYRDEAMFALTRQQTPAFLGGPYFANSLERAGFLSATIPSLVAADNASEADALAALFDHARGAVCQHGIGADQFWTQYACLIDPRQRSLQVYYGPPCAGRTTRWELPG
jgi:predicted choloylglycine hydrolase